MKLGFLSNGHPRSWCIVRQDVNKNVYVVKMAYNICDAYTSNHNCLNHFFDKEMKSNMYCICSSYVDQIYWFDVQNIEEVEKLIPELVIKALGDNFADFL